VTEGQKVFRHPGLWIPIALATAACLGIAIKRSIDARAPSRDVHPFVELHAPRVEHAIAIDAEMDGKKVWESEAGSTGVFKDSRGIGMVPYTEAKVRWGERMLYFWLYAGDLDLEGSVTDPDGPVELDDSFHIELAPDDRVYTIEVSVLGTLADAVCTGTLGAAASERHCDAHWQSRASVAVDRDGTLNRVGDNDEEWIVEMAIPLSSLGMERAGAGTRIPFAIRRCDVGARGPGACGSFGMGEPRGEIVLDPTSVDGVQLAGATGRR
jgi:hypothetical protein